VGVVLYAQGAVVVVLTHGGSVGVGVGGGQAGGA